MWRVSNRGKTSCRERYDVSALGDKVERICNCQKWRTLGVVGDNSVNPK